MPRVFIGLGSNMGDRLRNISRATAAIARLHDTRLVQMAPIVETAPVGGVPQDLFLNSVLEIETSLEPFALLDQLKRIEQDLGRDPSAQRWGPRPIDLDILFYGDEVVVDDRLLIPHARLHERWFVLQPLSQLDPSLVHPTLHKLIRELLSEIPHPESVIPAAEIDVSASV